MSAEASKERPEPQIVELEAVPRPMFRPQVVVPLATLGSLFLIVLLSAFWSSSLPTFATRHPMATGLIAGAFAAPGAIIGRRLWARKRQRERRELENQHRQLPIDDRVRALLIDQRDYTDREVQVASALAGDGVVNLLVLMGKARALGRSPIDVPFEPIPLDESSPAFQSLSQRQAEKPVAQIGAAREVGPLDLPASWRRRLRLGAGWLAIGIFAFNLVLSSIRAWEIGKPTLEQMWWLGFFVLMVWGVGGMGAWRSTDQWLLVPGGIIRRSAKSRSSQWNLHLFTRSQGFLLITESRRRNRQVCVADATESATSYVTATEAELLLRAWLSPLPPPPIEQLGDLT